MFNRYTVESIANDNIPADVLTIRYDRSVDNQTDYALFWPRLKTSRCFVFLHGHGSHGDQLYIDNDIRKDWLPLLNLQEAAILTPNLRGNAWMSPPAVTDLNRLLAYLRAEYNLSQFIFVSGSMGGTSNLIYAILFPEDVSAVISLAAATDLASYFLWCRCHNTGIVKEIADAIDTAYCGSPDKVSGIYKHHSVIKNRSRLTMPVFLAHGSQDVIIPVSQSQQLFQLMYTKRNFTYKEIGDCPHAIPASMVKEGIAGLNSVI